MFTDTRPPRLGHRPRCRAVTVTAGVLFVCRRHAGHRGTAGRTATTRPAGRERGPMTFVTRAQWGSITTTRTPMPGALPELVIHHVAGQLPGDVVAEYAHMRALQEYAIRDKGYADLDYNLLVGPSGNVYEGRGIWSKSAATLDRNDVSRSVCAMGNYEHDSPTAALLDGIVAAGRMMLEQGAIAPSVAVYGHRDNPAHPHATVCPGANLYPHVGELASRIRQPAPVEEDTDMIVIHPPSGGEYMWAPGIKPIPFTDAASRDSFMKAFHVPEIVNVTADMFARLA